MCAVSHQPDGLIIVVPVESDGQRLLRLSKLCKVTAASVAPDVTEAISTAVEMPHGLPSLAESDRQMENSDTPPERAFSHRGQVLLADTVSGLVAAAVIAPVMTLFDISLIRAQLDGTTFNTAMRQVAWDLRCGRTAWSPFVRILATVYGSTYLVANHVAAYCEASGVDYRLPTIAATSAVNITGIAWKERRFAAELILGPARPMPLGSYGLFAVRDSMTITASFVLKNVFGEYLEEHMGMNHRHADIASLAVPVAAQVVNAPFHMLALDLIARPTATWPARLASVACGFPTIAMGRCLRIIPVYGVGGYLNACLREAMTGGGA